MGMLKVGKQSRQFWDKKTKNDNFFSYLYLSYLHSKILFVKINYNAFLSHLRCRVK